MTKLLVDGDILVYRCGFAVEKKKYLLTEIIGETSEIAGPFDNAKDANAELEKHPSMVRWERRELEPLENALHLVNQVLDGIRSVHPGSDIIVYLSGHTNFRDTVARTQKYKGNRDSQQKPAHWKGIRDHLISKWGAIISKDQEADDELGIAMSNDPDSICVSIDKDLDQLPGRHYNWVSGEGYVITPRQGTLSFYSQVLSGDPTDNVPGVPGIGRAKAEKLLEGSTSPIAAFSIVKDTYKSKGLSDEYLFEQARLVYIRRKEGEMWTPPDPWLVDVYNERAREEKRASL